MKQNIIKVLSALFNNRIEFPYAVNPAELSEETQHLLSAYVEAELEGKDAASLFPEVKRAIANFPAFAEEHTILYEILDAEHRGELEEPPYVPVFDFSYLNLSEPADSIKVKSIETGAASDQTSSMPWGFNRAGHLVIQFTQEIVTSLQTQAIQMAPVHNLRSGEAWRTWLEYSLPRPSADLDVTVTVKHVGNENAFCNVVVKVDIPSRDGWPQLAGSQVQLTGPEIESVWQETDPFGEVVFESIEKTAVPYLKFQVNPVDA